MVESPPPRRYRLAPAHLLVLLLATEGLLWLSERYGWFAFDEHKGWTVLIAIGAVLATAALLLLWLALALVFRRRFQFGLRTLFLLMLVVAVPCSWLAVQMKAARKQREAVVIANRIAIMYDFEEGDWIAEPAVFVTPAISAWSRERLGDDFFADVVDVDFAYNVEATDTEVKTLIVNLTRLKGLTLVGTPVTDAVIEPLLGLRRLVKLDLTGTRITDESLPTIGKMTQLEDLRLASTKITDSGIRNLQNLSAIQILILSGVRLTDASLPTIGALPKLTTLYLDKTRITDAGLKNIARLSELSYLDLSNTGVSDVGLKKLHGCYHKATLMISGTKATDDCIKRLQKSLPDCEVLAGIRLDKP